MSPIWSDGILMDERLLVGGTVTFGITACVPGGELVALCDLLALAAADERRCR